MEHERHPHTSAAAPAANLRASTHATSGRSAAAVAVADPEPPPSSSLDPYTAILELAERELQLARDGRIEDLRSLAGEWDELTADLPPQPPPAARGPLERAAVLHERTSATLQCLREALLCDLRTTARASRAAHGYAEQAPRRVHRMNRSA
jgi:hypothetical protein